MDKDVELGKQMWLMLADTFRSVTKDCGAHTHAEQVRVWAGFLAAAAGSMAFDLGKDDAIDVLKGVTEAAKIGTANIHLPGGHA